MHTSRVGDHEVCQEQEDLFVFRFGESEVSAEELSALTEIERAAWDLPHIYNLVLFTRGMSMSPGLIPRVARMMRHSPSRTTAIVTPAFSLRTYMDLVSRALRQVGVELNSRFFEDEQAARDWLEEKRRGRTI